MIPYSNIVKGEIKLSKIIDTRGVAWSPFNLPKNTPVLNPVSWKLHGDWEDGFHISNQTLIEIKNGEIISAYTLKPLSLEDGDVLRLTF
jgi:hypothetical protein